MGAYAAQRGGVLCHSPAVPQSVYPSAGRDRNSPGQHGAAGVWHSVWPCGRMGHCRRESDFRHSLRLGRVCLHHGVCGQFLLHLHSVSAVVHAAAGQGAHSPGAPEHGAGDRQIYSGCPDRFLCHHRVPVPDFRGGGVPVVFLLLPAAVLQQFRFCRHSRHPGTLLLGQNPAAPGGAGAAGKRKTPAPRPLAGSAVGRHRGHWRGVFPLFLAPGRHGGEQPACAGVPLRGDRGSGGLCLPAGRQGRGAASPPGGGQDLHQGQGDDRLSAADNGLPGSAGSGVL